MRNPQGVGGDLACGARPAVVKCLASANRGQIAAREPGRAPGRFPREAFVERVSIMATRAYWSGRIRLALVSIPVHLFSATTTTTKISFNQVHKPSGKRIRYEKVVPGIGPVDAEDIVKGYEVSKGKYVLFEDEELDEVKLEAKKSLDLVQFVDDDEIDPIYFERPFFVVPDDENEDAEEAYVVLRDALKKTKKVGLGQLVIRGKGSMVALKPRGKGLLLETLRYADEVKKADSFFSELPKGDANKELIGLAEELIERKAEKFDPQKFKDAYAEAVDLGVRDFANASYQVAHGISVDGPPELYLRFDTIAARDRHLAHVRAANSRHL